MIVKQLCVQNQFINYSDLTLDFSKDNIYLLIGENGTGKTTIMKNIVFSDNEVVFSNEKLEDAYLNDRYKLFSYVPQNIAENDCSVWKYLYKDNPNVSKREIARLMHIFCVEDIEMSQKYNLLSGGEKVKLSIIAALAKKTPYVFLDEPTNYMDDTSVNCLVKIINEYSKDITFIIISHDTRLIALKGTKIIFDGRNATVSEENGNRYKRIIEKKQKKVSVSKVLIKNVSSLVNYMLLLLTFISVNIMGFYFQYIYNINYSNDEIPTNNIIMVYSADYGYSDLNKTYVENVGIDIAEENLHNMIYVEDIEELSNISGVKDIYVKDVEKYSEFVMNTYNIGLTGQNTSLNAEDESSFIKNYVFSLPSIWYENKVIVSNFAVSDFLYLETGRLPKDNCYEICLSEKILNDYFGLKEQELKNYLGKTVVVDSEVYTIVGINVIDVCLLSYSDEKQYGMYKYSAETIEEYCKYLNAYYTENGFIHTNLDCCIIMTENMSEKYVLNKVLQNYPAHNYYSAEYVKSWMLQHNLEFESKIYVIFAMISMILGICYWAIQKNNYKINIMRLEDYGNYYIVGKNLYTYFLIFNCVLWGIVGLLSLICQLLIDNIYHMFNKTCGLTCLVYTLLVFPSFLYTMVISLRKR